MADGLSATETLNTIFNGVTMMATAVAVVYGIREYERHRASVHYEANHALSRRILTAAYRFRLELKLARHPIHRVEMFKSAKMQATATGVPINMDTGQPWCAALVTRAWRLHRYWKVLQTEFAEGEAVWGPEWAKQVRAGTWNIYQEWMDAGRRVMKTAESGPFADAEQAIQNDLVVVTHGSSDHPDEFDVRINDVFLELTNSIRRLGFLDSGQIDASIESRP